MSTVISLSSSQSSDSAQLAKADASVPSARVLEQVCAMATKARKAQARLAQANSQRKNLLLNAIADALVEHADDIAAANELDMQ
ncbi:MAG: gamma-glutamyl-phosphate reductase, partial [Bifidobacterium aquikefiri]